MQNNKNKRKQVDLSINDLNRGFSDQRLYYNKITELQEGIKLKLYNIIYSVIKYMSVIKIFIYLLKYSLATIKYSATKI